MNGYLLQAIAIPLWWLGMATSPDVYACFEYPGITRQVLFSFMTPDLILISMLSFVARRHPNDMLHGIILGGFAYGALWCVTASFLTGGGFLSSIVMVLGALFNVMLCLGQASFRMSRTNSRAVNVAKTCMQSMVVWGAALVLFPSAIVHATGDWPPQPAPVAMIVGGGVFAVCSLLGIWSGVVMASEGRGTPLPLDAPQRLVVTGPYAYVRNPMAIAGLGQGFGVAMILSSTWVAVYVAIGMIVWNYFARPEEERYMQGVFGDEFERYRAHVRCWSPRLRRYSG